MSSHGIRDRVAIVGMGCTPFGEHWDRSADDLLIDAVGDALTSAGVTIEDIDAFWLGTQASGVSGLALSRPLHLRYRPVTRLENMCATGSEALRNACYAVASGAYDVAMAVGVEKLKDSGMWRPNAVRLTASDLLAAEGDQEISFRLLGIPVIRLPGSQTAASSGRCAGTVNSSSNVPRVTRWRMPSSTPSNRSRSVCWVWP